MKEYNYIVTKGGVCLTGFTNVLDAEQYARQVGGKVEENDYEKVNA